MFWYTRKSPKQRFNRDVTNMQQQKHQIGVKANVPVEELYSAL